MNTENTTHHNHADLSGDALKGMSLFARRLSNEKERLHRDEVKRAMALRPRQRPEDIH